jgi:hypothetical protein
MQDHQSSIIGNAPSEEKKVEDPIEMARQLAFFKHILICSSTRKERVEDLMSRSSAKKWDAKKKQRMVRRLMTANQELEQSSDAVEQLSSRLVELLKRPPPMNSAPFVPTPATSI